MRRHKAIEVIKHGSFQEEPGVYYSVQSIRFKKTARPLWFEGKTFVVKKKQWGDNAIIHWFYDPVEFMTKDYPQSIFNLTIDLDDPEVNTLHKKVSIMQLKIREKVRPLADLVRSEKVIQRKIARRK